MSRLASGSPTPADLGLTAEPVGLVFNIQKYSLHDGPGIRTTVFLKGCPLRCAWCHNPEGMSAQPEVLVLENRCVGCGLCRQACPLGQEVLGSGPMPTGLAQCRRCGACVAACPTGARQMAGQSSTVGAVLAQVLQDRVFYEESGGGLTVSGGEPLAQPEFLLGLLSAAKAQGLHIALDTCGFGRTEDLLAAAGRSDLVLYDLKLIDEGRHREHTGVSNRLILANLQALNRVGVPLWIRVPLIPGITDDAANLEAIARLVSGLRAVQQINLLPYHRTGLAKWRRVGQPSRLQLLAPPSEAEVARAVQMFAGLGLTVKVGG